MNKSDNVSEPELKYLKKGLKQGQSKDLTVQQRFHLLNLLSSTQTLVPTRLRQAKTHQQ